MNSRRWPRLAVLIVFTALSIFMVIPTIFSLGPEGGYPIKRKVNLGLDLQGGLYMILGVDFPKAYRDEVETSVRRMITYLKDEGLEANLGPRNSQDPESPRQWLEFQGAQKERVRRALEESGILANVKITGENAHGLELALNRAGQSFIDDQAVEKSIEVIRNRIDEFGVTEPAITSQGRDRIVVQLPGVRDIERAKSLIGQTAKLEFRMVKTDKTVSELNLLVDRAREEGKIEFQKGGRFSEYLEKLNSFLKKDLPKGTVVAFEKKVHPQTGELLEKLPYLVEEVPSITGQAVQDARVATDPQTNYPYVSLEFKSQGAVQFEKLTDENVGQAMAIILDGNVYSAPQIRERISGGQAQITLGPGSYSQRMKEARDLALVLRAGALPVELNFQEQRAVGPSLGEDSIVRARYAGLFAVALVFIFLIVYYRRSGAVAATTLGLNVLFVLALLVALEATLTLPGIAGIVLTVGMAVDANIVIYERIREGLRQGLTPYKAVEGGFARAFWTIIDANITTALAGLALINFGTGPIRGFAVTLLIGIASTVYSSYFVGKLLFEINMDRASGQRISI